MSLEPIPQLLFSTRAADPKVGLDFNRELIGCTAGLDEEAQNFFTLRADLTYSTSRQPKLQPICSVASIDDDRWLFFRAVSLGRYRKSSHQMLIHGLVLRSDHLQILDWNPFLLCRLDGIDLVDTHPGRRGELAALRLPAGIESKVQETNKQRLKQLQFTLDSNHRSSFAPLLSLVRRSTDPVACVSSSQPDAELIEALLLHFHAEDRPWLSFHSWYVQDRRLDYRLLFISEAELPLVRRHFPRLEVWTPEKSNHDSVAGLTCELRTSSVDDFFDTLEKYRITYFCDRPVPTIDAEDAEWCLRDGLKQTLDDHQRKRLGHLAQRSGNPLIFSADDLLEIWPAGHDAFEERARKRLARIGPVSQQMIDDALGRLLGSIPPSPPSTEFWLPRWGLLVMWKHFDPEFHDQRAQAWRQLIPIADLEGAMQILLGDASGAASKLLDEYVILDAESLANIDVAAELSDQLYWPRYLRWLATSGSGLGSMVPRIEGIIGSIVQQPRALVWLAELQTICNLAKLPVATYRLIFEREIPLLEPHDRRERIREAVHALLEDPTGSCDLVLRTFLGRQPLAGNLWTAMADWILAQPDLEVAWQRWLALIKSQEQSLELEAASAGGGFIYRLAFTPLCRQTFASCQALVTARAKTVAEEFFLSRLLQAVAEPLLEPASQPLSPQVSLHLPDLIIGLIQARSLNSKPIKRLDQILLDLLFFGHQHVERVLELIDLGSLEIDPEIEIRTLRGALSAFLKELLTRGGPYFDDLFETDLTTENLPQIERRRDWSHLLLDDLHRSPPADGLDDGRYRSCLEIAWHVWRDAEDPEGASRIRILSLLQMDPKTGRDNLQQHKLVMRRLVGDREALANSLLEQIEETPVASEQTDLLKTQTSTLSHEVLPQM